MARQYSKRCIATNLKFKFYNIFFEVVLQLQVGAGLYEQKWGGDMIEDWSN